MIWVGIPTGVVGSVMAEWTVDYKEYTTWTVLAVDNPGLEYEVDQMMIFGQASGFQARLPNRQACRMTCRSFSEALLTCRHSGQCQVYYILEAERADG